MKIISKFKNTFISDDIGQKQYCGQFLKAIATAAFLSLVTGAFIKYTGQEQGTTIDWWMLALLALFAVLSLMFGTALSKKGG